jgi:hypothetical protein
LVVALLEQGLRHTISTAAVVALALIAASIAAVETRAVVAGLVVDINSVVSAEWSEAAAVGVAVRVEQPIARVQRAVVAGLESSFVHHSIAALRNNATTFCRNANPTDTGVAGARNRARRAIEGVLGDVKYRVEALGRARIVAAIEGTDVAVIDGGRRASQTMEAHAAFRAVAYGGILAVGAVVVRHAPRPDDAAASGVAIRLVSAQGVVHRDVAGTLSRPQLDARRLHAREVADARQADRRTHVVPTLHRTRAEEAVVALAIQRAGLR